MIVRLRISGVVVNSISKFNNKTDSHFDCCVESTKSEFYSGLFERSQWNSDSSESVALEHLSKFEWKRLDTANRTE